MPSVISDRQLEEFEAEGLVTVDGPLCERELATLRTVLDAKFRQPSDVFVAETSGQFFEPEVINLILHPFWEVLARPTIAGAFPFRQSGARRVPMRHRHLQT